jgi:hypothetical protein
MSNIWPQYLFTATFLKALDDECTRREVEGEKLGVLNRFLGFMEEAKGQILIDIENLKIGESLRLRKWFKETDAQFGPYQRQSDPSERPEDIELEAAASFDTSFTASYNSSQIDAMMRTVHKPIFNLDLVTSKWDSLAGLNFPLIRGGKRLSWNDLLSNYVLPSSQILICDPYIANNKVNVDKNLLPILKACRSISRSKPAISLIAREPTNFDLKQHLVKKLGDISDIKIILLPHWDKSYEEHDRRILTDQLFINIPSGLDLINSRDYVGAKKSTDIALRSIYSGNQSQLEAIVDTKNRLEQIIIHHTSEEFQS